MLGEGAMLAFESRQSGTDSYAPTFCSSLQMDLQ